MFLTNVKKCSRPQGRKFKFTRVWEQKTCTALRWDIYQAPFFGKIYRGEKEKVEIMKETEGGGITRWEEEAKYICQNVCQEIKKNKELTEKISLSKKLSPFML